MQDITTGWFDEILIDRLCLEDIVCNRSDEYFCLKANKTFFNTAFSQKSGRFYSLFVRKVFLLGQAGKSKTRQPGLFHSLELCVDVI